MTCPFCGSEDIKKTVARPQHYVPNSYRCSNCKPKRSWWTPTPRTRPLRATPMPFILVDGVRHLQP